ncbi:MAG: serine/threonine-protein kinase, partial [Planctomycetota bacterium]
EQWIGVLRSSDPAAETVGITSRSEITHSEPTAETSEQETPSTSGSLPDLERYEVHREIGRGGMGVVYEATHRELGRRVAVKMLLSGILAGPERMERFRRESQAIATIAHPNIVQIFDVGQHQGVPFFALEYVDDGSLDEKLDGTPWNPSAAAQLVQSVAEGVQAAHQLGFIHRDLKPANILVVANAESRSGWEPKVTDFGLVKRDVDATLTRSGIAVGTPRYLAPEQANGDESKIQVQSDVYSLGCILYELLTGRPPFQAETLADTIRHICESEPVDARRLNSSIPRDLATICHKCLQKNPASRYCSAKSLAEDIQRFRNQQPVLARPTSFVAKASKWARRNPFVTTLLTIIAAALVALVFVWVDFTQKLKAKTKLASEKAELAVRRQQEAVDAAEARSETLTFFTQDLLQAIAPESGGRDVTVFEVLKAADKQIEERFEDRPVIESAIRMGIAESLEALGEYREALPHAQHAAELLEQTTGAGGFETMKAKILSADLHASLSETDQALALLREMEPHKAAVNEDMRFKLDALFAHVLFSAGRYREAKAELEQLYERSLATNGPTHETTLTQLNNLACAIHESGDLQDAQKLFLKYREMVLEKYGPAHLRSLESTRVLAVSYGLTGKVKEALNMQRDGYKLCLEIYGDHPKTTTTLHNYALALSRNKQYDEARPLLEQALRESIDRFGTNHETSLNYLGNLAYMHFEFGHVDRAAECLEKHCDPIQSDAFDHPHWGVLLLTYGRVRQRMKQYEEAQSLFEQADGIFKRSSGTTTLMTKTLADSMKRLAKQMAKDSSPKPR